MDLSKIIVESAKLLGIHKLKDKQMEAISSFVQGNDTFVSLPTGYGKSVIYAVLPYVFDRLKGSSGSIALCISPLTSLMMDQCSKYTPSGLKVEFIGESQTDQTAKDRVFTEKVQLIFISPESIISKAIYRNMLMSPIYKEKLIALVVDEAHCMKTWGDKFRKTFANIGELRSIIPVSVKVLALTATATTETFFTVTRRLSMDNPNLVALPPNRDNIGYKVAPKIDIHELTNSLCVELKSKRCYFPKTIVFVRTYQDCSNIYMFLKKKMGTMFTEPAGYPNVSAYRLVDMYSRVSTIEKKEEVLQSFCVCGGKLRLVIATTAFGLEIDCPDIRRIIHWGLPTSMEEYVQEARRASCDGIEATALLYAGKGGTYSTQQMKDYVSNSSQCRRRFLFQNFLKYSEKDIEIVGCKCCDICSKSCECVMNSK